MAEVRFGRIEYHNFMSFASQEWDFGRGGELFLISGRNLDLKEDESGVAASNGSGKTNLVQGLMYALYGQFPSKVHNANVVNKYSRNLDADGYMMRVTLELSAGGEDFVVVRGILGNSPSTVRLSVFKKREDGATEDVSKSSSALTQAYIDGVLGMNFQSFQRLVMLSSEPAYNFFQMTAGQKRDLIEQLFDTGTYTAMWEMAKKDQNRAATALQSRKVKLNALEVQLSDYDAEIKKFSESSAEQVRNLEAGLEALLLRAKEQAERSGLSEEKAKALKEKFEKVAKAADKAKVRLGEIRSKLAVGENALESEKAKVSRCLKELDKHKDILDVLCEDCSDKVRGMYRLGEYESAISESRCKIDKIDAAIEKLRAAESVASDRIRSSASELAALKSDAEAAYSEAMNDKLQAGDTLAEIKASKARISELKGLPGCPLEGAKKAVEESIEAAKKSISECESELSVLSMCESVVSPEAVRKNIVARVVDGINELVNRRLEELNTPIRCEFDQQMEKCGITAPGGWEIDYQNLSKGERMKLLLAVNLAFREFLLLRLGISCNCLVLDEIVDQNFDTLSISRIMDLLLRMSRRDGTHVYIISHRGEVSSLADNLAENSGGAGLERVLVEKKGNISSAGIVF